jgi:hypothetical protein
VGDPRARALLRGALVAPIMAVVRARFRIETRGLQHFSRAPSTLIVSNHHRDSDAPILANVLFGHGRPPGSPRLPHFVAREDLFGRGFLAAYLQRWPAPVRTLLRPLNLAPVLALFQAHPMRRIPERTLGAVLADILDVLGDAPLDEVLRPDLVAALERASGQQGAELHVRDVMHRRYRRLLRRPGGLFRLTKEAFDALKPHEVAVIEGQLRTFVALLEEGKIVNLEPEGVLSSDGRFSRLREGLHVLINEPRAATRVLPVGITHDFMTTGRTTVFVGVGEELTDLRGLPRREAARRVTAAIVAQATVTATHLAGRALKLARAEGTSRITLPELSEHIAGEAARFAARGAYVDPRLLDDSARARRLSRLVRYCENRGIVGTRPDGSLVVGDAEGGPPVGRFAPVDVISYADRELAVLSRYRPPLA